MIQMRTGGLRSWYRASLGVAEEEGEALKLIRKIRAILFHTAHPVSSVLYEFIVRKPNLCEFQVLTALISQSQRPEIYLLNVLCEWLARVIRILMRTQTDLQSFETL